MRKFHLFTCSLLGVMACAYPVCAQNTCEKVGGGKVCTIELQNAPNNMEPVGEPTRIRVDDRSPVRLHLVNLSPLDVCSLGGRTPTPTVERNPFESFITNLSTLEGSGLSAGTASQAVSLESKNLPSNTGRATPIPILDDPKYKLFLDAAANFSKSAQDVVTDQRKAQTALESDMTLLSNYAWADYRGAKWVLFHPQDDPKLDEVRSHFGKPLPTITDAALSQAILGEMTGWAGDLHKGYDKNTDADTLAALKQVDVTLEKAKASVSILTDYNGALKTAQGNARTGYNSLVKVYIDFERLLTQHIISKSADNTFLIQNFNLGTDRKTTITGYASCVSDIDGKTATTDQIDYSVLYQNVPVLSTSVGLLTTFQELRVIGTTTQSASNPAGFNTIFAVTNYARAQVFPMAFFNYRFPRYTNTHWYKRPEDELNITYHLSGGIGVNPNTGSNETEFFVGMAFGFNKLMIHPGVHFGRAQSLGGNFVLTNPVPTGYTGPMPINWSYRPAFSIGFSVRVAPW
jgi:hypothetical protein